MSNDKTGHSRVSQFQPIHGKRTMNLSLRQLIDWLFCNLRWFVQIGTLFLLLLLLPLLKWMSMPRFTHEITITFQHTYWFGFSTWLDCHLNEIIMVAFFYFLILLFCLGEWSNYSALIAFCFFILGNRKLAVEFNLAVLLIIIIWREVFFVVVWFSSCLCCDECILELFSSLETICEHEWLDGKRRCSAMAPTPTNVNVFLMNLCVHKCKIWMRWPLDKINKFCGSQLKYNIQIQIQIQFNCSKRASGFQRGKDLSFFS